MLSDHPATSCFSVYAPSDPAVLPRVLGVFARQDVVPSRVVAAPSERRPDELSIDLQVEGMGVAKREYIAARLRNLIDVSLVLTSEKKHYRAA